MRLLPFVLIATAPVVLRPGASDLVTDHLGNARQTVRLMKADSELGRFSYDWHVLHDDQLLLVTRGEVRGKTFNDSSLVKRHGLTPIREVSEFDGKVKRWTYDGSVFTFQELEDLLRSLPLREGYERILPLFSEGDDSTEMDTVRVMGRTGRKWTLRFADPAIVATYEVDERTRRVVRHEFVMRKTGERWRYLLDTPDTSMSSAPPG